MNKPGYKYFKPAAYEPRLPVRRRVEIKAAPPEPGKGCANSLTQWGSVVIGILTLAATVFFAFFGQEIIGSSNLQIVVLAGVGIGLSAIITGFTVFLTTRRANKDVRSYKQYLAKTEQELKAEAENYIKILYSIDPNPDQLENVVAEGRGRYLWERQPGHVASFLNVRVGITPQRPGPVELQNPSYSAGQFQQTELSRTLSEMLNRTAFVQNVPGLINLREVRVLGIAGPRQSVYELCYALMGQLAVHHSPENLRIAVFFSQLHSLDWFWAGWLPHCQPLDQDLQRPLLSGDTNDNKALETSLKDILLRRQEKGRNMMASSETTRFQLNLPYLVVVIDCTEGLPIDQGLLTLLLRDGPSQNIHVIFLARTEAELPNTALAYISLLPEGQMRVVVSGRDGSQLVNSVWKSDRLPLEQAETLARELAPLSLSESAGAFVLPNSVNFFEVLKWSSVTGQVVAERWNTFSKANLEALLGLRDNGQPMVINLDEAVNGTHGVIAGATGTGKGVLLSTLITSLALNNHPSRLNFVLADFKGGATFRVFENLPHTVGIVTDQIDEFGLARFLLSIEQELKRRKQLIDAAQRKYGNQVQKIRDFEEVAPTEVFPFLLVIIDEFAELARSAPEMMDQLVVIAQQGRSLGVFLLLSMQTTDTLKGAISANLRYRIALRMAQKSESKDLIGDEAAAGINGRNRGRAYFRCDDELALFQSANLLMKTLDQSGKESGPSDVRPSLVKLVKNDWKMVSPHKNGKVPAGALPPKQSLVRTDLEVTVEACREAAKLLPLSGELFIPWRAPLPASIPVTGLLPDSFKDGHFAGWPERKNWLSVPVAMLDRYWEQSQPVLYSEFTRGRHLEFLGVQDSGRTSALLSTVLGLAATHRPEELVLLFIDFGSTLSLFRKLGYDGEYLSAGQFKQIEDLIADLVSLLDRRRQLFGNLPDGSVAKNLEEYRAIQARAGAAPEKQPQAIFVIIDNYSAWAQTHPDFNYAIAPQIKNLVQNGATYGIYFILTADKPNDVLNDNLAANFQKIMLRMDPDDLGVSPYNKKIMGVWHGKSGRGFIENVPPYNLVELQCLTPAPVDETEQMQALQALIAEISARNVMA
jgi:S-DNA-T family DNA segregation ATPase FtsK/SpoIIIE